MGSEMCIRDSAEAAESGPTLRLLTFRVDADSHDVIGDEPISHNGEVIGWVTSGGYAHAQDASIAMGYVPAELEGTDGTWEIEVVGEIRTATPLTEVLWDPTADRMRG